MYMLIINICTPTRKGTHICTYVYILHDTYMHIILASKGLNIGGFFFFQVFIRHIILLALECMLVL